MISENVSNYLSVINKVNDDVTLFSDASNIPFNKVIIKNPKDIINRMLLDYTLSIFATYALDNASYLINAAYIKLDEKFNIKDILSLKDKTTILDIIKDTYSIRDLEDISWLLEDVRVYMWVLGLLEKPSFDKECDVKEINKVLFKLNDINDLINSVKFRSKEEIVDYFNVIIKNRGSKKDTNPLVIQEQLDALSYITSYDANENFKKLISVNYKNKDINIEFNVPEDLIFDKIAENSKELFTISSEDRKIKMVMFDFGEFKNDFDSKIDKYINLYLNNNFNIINKYTLSSHNLKHKIHQILITRDNVIINSYLFAVSNHIFRLDSLVDKSTNYNDYNSLVNSKSVNIDMDLLFSIKERQEDIDDEVYHEYDYSNIIPSKNNINEILKHVEEVYRELLKNKRSGKLEFNILIDSVYNNEIICNSLKEYNEYDEIGYTNKVNKLVISLLINNIDINTKSNNTFELSLEPYNIKFVRKSSKKEKNMDQVEEYINTLLKKLPVSNTIFYTK